MSRKTILILAVLIITAVCAVYSVRPEEPSKRRSVDKGDYEYYIDSNTDSQSGDLYFYGK